MKTILTRAFNKAGMWFLIIVAAVVWVNGQQEIKTFDKPAPVGSYEDILTKNVCADTVEGKFPSSVIMYDAKTSGYVFSNREIHVSKGLDEEFAEKEWKRYTVVHFCK